MNARCKISIFLMGFLAVAMTTGCGESDPSANVVQSTTCGVGVVVIQVFDGILRSACGCNEGIQVKSGSALTCTFDTGSTVFFQANSIKVQHQIQIENLITGPIWVPTTETNVESIAKKIVAAGTYNFSDLMVPGMTGSLIAL